LEANAHGDPCSRTAASNLGELGVFDALWQLPWWTVLDQFVTEALAWAIVFAVEPANDTDIRTKQLWNRLVVLRRLATWDTAIPLEAARAIHMAFTRLIRSGW
jgi:hypothetical protein